MSHSMSSVRHSGHGYPRGGLHGQIVHAIGRQILSGKIRPGEVLPAQPAFPASRTVLREAIKVLAAKGLVESRPRTGTRVRPRHAWHLLDPDVMAWQQQDGPPRVEFLQKLTEVRLIVEPAAAERAAQRATSADIQTIEEAYRDMEASLDGVNDYEAFDQADRRFHQAIVRACGNDLLERMSHVVVSALLVSFHTTSRLPGRAKASLPVHRSILESIRAGQGQLASQTMRRLVLRTAREIERLAKRPRR